MPNAGGFLEFASGPFYRVGNDGKSRGELMKICRRERLTAMANFVNERNNVD